MRLWGVGGAAGAGAPSLAALPAFAPSVEDPAAAMVDPGVSWVGLVTGLDEVDESGASLDLTRLKGGWLMFLGE